MAGSMAGSRSSHPGALQDGCWTPGPELSWHRGGWLAQPGQTQQTQAPDCVLGLGGGNNRPRAERPCAGFHAGLSASRPGKEKGEDVVKCEHTAPG